MMSAPRAPFDESASADAVRQHYDSLSFLYSKLWGKHIHHGYWEDGERLSQSQAQVKLIEQLCRRAGISRGARVLDVGCGIGGSSLWLAGEMGCEVQGITISPVQAEMALQAAAAQGLSDRVRFTVLDAAEMATRLPPGSFDLVWVIECSEHLSDKHRFIHDCAKILKPGGRLALCTWLSVPPTAAPDRAALVAQVCHGMLCPSLATQQDYSAWMTDSGFEKIRAEDVTRHVQATWDRCAAILRRREVRAVLRSAGPRLRAFADAFSAIQRAYRTGAMAYGMFTAVNSRWRTPLPR